MLVPSVRAVVWQCSKSHLREEKKKKKKKKYDFLIFTWVGAYLDIIIFTNSS